MSTCRVAGVAVGIALLVLAPSTAAKARMSLVVGDASPAVGQPTTLVLRMELAQGHTDVMVVAVAPGHGWYDVVGTVTGHSSRAHARIPRDGFRVRLTRVAADRWRAFVSFPRPGRWLLVVPNWGGVPGFAIPPPIMRPVRVSDR